MQTLFDRPFAAVSGRRLVEPVARRDGRMSGYGDVDGFAGFIIKDGMYFNSFRLDPLYRL